jgi:hypothetical protein
MNVCLQNIVSVKDLCPGAIQEVSTSGYDIWQAPEVRYKGIAAITDEKYVRGRNMLVAIREMAIREVESDFLKIITTNGYNIDLGIAGFSTGQFNATITNAPAPVERGIVIHSARPSVIRKIKITQIQVFPVDSVAVIPLKIYDNGQVATYNIQLVGGQINTFNIDYTASGDFIRIVLDSSALRTYGSQLTCMVGCGGTLPNECGYVKGWNGTGEVKSEGFGINAVFSCDCAYSQLLCYWAKQFVGEIVWYKMRALVQEERLNSDRLNNFTIYNREEAKEKHAELENIYREKWNTFAHALPELLKNLRDSCIICNKAKWVTNV